MTAQPTTWSSLLKTAFPAVFLLSVGSWPLVTHPHAEAYQPWLYVGVGLCCLVGGAGAAGAPQATTITSRRLSRAAMVAALIGLVALSAIVLTDALCLSGYRIPDGSCAWE